VAWVAFEYDGPAWQEIARRQDMVERTARGGPFNDSRLVPVDAAVDASLLRRRYEGQPVIVMPAVIQMRYATDPLQGPSVWGALQRLASPEVTVPARLRDRLRDLPARPEPQPADGQPLTPPPPRYDVVLGVGRLGFVWVQDLVLRAQ